MSDVTPPPTDRLDRLLLEAGFEVDPDHALSGRVADESPDDDGRPDPWGDSVTAEPLSTAQREWLDLASPALGASLPATSLTGDDPFGPSDPDALADADDEIIDFD